MRISIRDSLWMRLMVLFTLCALMLGGLTLYAQPSQAQPEPCSADAEFKQVPGLGKSCRLPNGYWKVKLPDGTTMLSHGPDKAPALEPAGDAPSLAAVGTAVTCAPAGSYRALVLYLRAPGVADQYSARVGTIRGYIQQMQDHLYNESMEFGVTSSYRVACDANGQVTVRNVALSTSAQDLGAVTNDLKAKGYNSTFEKYIMIYERSGCGGGVAWAETNDALTVNNRANQGPSYGVSWGFCGYGTVMHENAHNMGAVMNSAPNTSGAGHCIDDRDVMCYDDGGPRAGQLRIVCNDREHFDCGHNDYFHPNPPAGSYLATHWNIGNCMNRFISRSGCGGTTTGVRFYQDANYGGASSGLKAKGSYGVLPSDVPNDWMSSLRVPAGWIVDAYEHGNFGGAVCTFTADTGWVGTACNDKMSSFRIR